MSSRLEKLKTLLKDMESVLVAYSGGVDSTFLLKVAHDVLGERSVAATALTASFPRSELDASRECAAQIGARQVFIETKELGNAGYRRNASDRCYFCKEELFNRLAEVASREGCNCIVYGEIADDSADHRPGAQAARKLGIRAPLAEAGFSKQEIRDLSKQLGLATWDKPSMACLASRIPYGTEVTTETLQKIERAEEVLRSLGLRQYRVRHHGEVARIEVEHGDLEKLAGSPLRNRIVSDLKQLGYRYVALDLQGYRTGSLNETLPPGA